MMAGRGATAAAAAAPALLGVTFIKSGIRANKKVVKVLESLHLNRLHKQIVVKNTPTICGKLKAVIKHVTIRPVQFAPGVTKIGENTFMGHDFVIRERVGEKA
eukprot:m.79680 g.79680  ORF g.79680 m.79680 type:complete len:103 (+) comp19315_c0_seq1:46-354(+)